MRYFSTLGLAIATCISTSVVCIRIILLLERKFSFNIVSYISLTLGKSAIATLFMGLVIIFIRRLYIMFIGFTTYWHIFILLLLAFVCGVFIYLIFLWLLRLEDIYILKNILVKQGSHK